MSAEALQPREETLLAALRKHPKGIDQATLIADLQGWTDNDVAECLNALSSKHYVEFMHGPGQRLIFRAKDIEEINKTGSMSDNERIVYQFIKASGNKGTWIKDIKAKSGLHVQIVTQMIKNLERKVLIKAVKSVKTPTKKVYMLAEFEPSVELTGGAWYTDQELDVEFIDQLSNQLHKYIHSKSFPPDPEAIFPASHAFPTCSDIHRWIARSGITSVELSRSDVQSLLDRLVFDGKIEQVQNTRSAGGVRSARMASPPLMPMGASDRARSMRGMISNADDDDDEWGASEEVVGDLEDDAWSYRAVRGVRGEGAAWTDAPCGRCPVFTFCSEGGPVNPSGCVYLKRWLEI